jgi:hypothetical protein
LPSSGGNGPTLIPTTASKSFESADIQTLTAASTSDLAPILDASRKQWRFHPVVLILALSALAFAIASESQAAFAVVLPLGLLCWSAAFVDDRRRLTTTLNYNLADEQKHKFGQPPAHWNAIVTLRPST